MAGSLLIDTLEPTGADTPLSSAAYDVNASGMVGTANGQSFSTTSAFNLARITMVKGSTQGYTEGNSLRLHFFAWNPTNDANDISFWGAGDGTADGDPLNGTGMTSLFSQDFELPSGTHQAGAYIHFNLGAPIALAANTAYGFTVEFVHGGFWSQQSQL